MPFKPTTQTNNDGEPTYGDTAYAAAYGAGTGLLGSLGEGEKFLANTVPQYLGLQEEGKKDDMGFGRETFFPTIKEAQKVADVVGIPRPKEESKTAQDVGEFVGQMATSIPGLAKGAVKGMIGLSSKTGESSARALEKLGFKVSPAQVRRVDPVGQKGAKGFTEHNQDLANKLATKGTGETTTNIYPGFIGGRLRDLGKEFDAVYKGKTFTLDQPAIDAIHQISQREAAAIGNSGVSSVKQAADEIIANYQSLMQQGGKKNTFAISGEGLQKLRNALSEQGRSASNVKGYEIYNLIDKVDQSIARNHPKVAKTLNEIRPKYRNAIILEDLQKQGGIHAGDISLDRLGRMLESQGTERIAHPKDIDQLGLHGKQTNMKATWESAGVSPTETGQAIEKGLNTKMQFIPRMLRPEGTTSRKLQKFYSEPASSTVDKVIKEGVGSVAPGVPALGKLGTVQNITGGDNNE